MVHFGKDVIDPERSPLSFRQIRGKDIPVHGIETSAQDLPSLRLVESQGFPAAVLIDGEQMGAIGDQRGPKTQKILEDVKDIAHAQSHGPGENRWQSFFLPIPKEVIQGDIIPRAGRGDMRYLNSVFF
jgi:hypothetical protein